MTNPELKKIWQDLKSSPAVLVTIIVVIVLIIWYVYKQNNVGGTSGAVVGTGSTGSDTLYFLNTSQGSPPGDTGTTTGSTTGTSGTSTGSTGTTGTTGTSGIVGKAFALTKSASLEDNPRGKVLKSIPQGADVTVLTKTTKPDPQGTSKVYYWVNYQGTHGWLGSDSFNVGS